jgi:hypothetical protein
LFKIFIMISIQLQVSEEVIGKFGILAITARLQKELETERMKILADEIQKELLAVGLDVDMLAKQARHLAWNEYKAKYLTAIS